MREVGGHALKAREEADVHGAPQVGAAPQFNSAVGPSEQGIHRVDTVGVSDNDRRDGVGEAVCLCEVGGVVDDHRVDVWEESEDVAR